MRCIISNVLQTKVDAQCDKLATELLTTLATVDFFELQRVICRKSQILTYSAWIWRLRWGNPI